VRRNKKGEIFCMFPTDQHAWSPTLNWDLHRSKHGDGTTHSKSHGVKSNVRLLQRPDAGFKGTENLTTRSIAADEPRAFGVPCLPADFDEVMEVSVSDLDTAHYATHFSVDLTGPGGPPIVTPGARIFRHHRLTDALPEILVTLFRTV
jgi:hypothetical protein